MTLFKICKRPCFAGLTFENRSQVGGNRIGNPKHFKISEAEHLEIICIASIFQRE